MRRTSPAYWCRQQVGAGLFALLPAPSKSTCHVQHGHRRDHALCAGLPAWGCVCYFQPTFAAYTCPGIVWQGLESGSFLSRRNKQNSTACRQQGCFLVTVESHVCPCCAGPFAWGRGSCLELVFARDSWRDAWLQAEAADAQEQLQDILDRLGIWDASPSVNGAAAFGQLPLNGDSK